MIKTAKQLKDLIRNLSKKKSADAQMLMRHYMMERFLERISLSEYKDKFILKGGILVTAMIGLNARSTMDLDATVKGINVNAEDVEQIIALIASVPLDDGVSFCIKSIGEIMDVAEYPGIRVSIETKFDGVITPFKVDISTGDIITLKEVHYQLKLMLEDRAIDIWAYNLETILAEKLETIIARNTTNTRMRDFYDIHSLLQLYGENINSSVFNEALMATANKRGTEHYLKDMLLIVDEVENNNVMENLWLAYQKKFSYASDISWGAIMESVRACMELIGIKERNE
jgi:predicted nucleotidyltransferase component of viral defense system